MIEMLIHWVASTQKESVLAKQVKKITNLEILLLNLLNLQHLPKKDHCQRIIQEQRVLLTMMMIIMLIPQLNSLLRNYQKLKEINCLQTWKLS